MKCVFAECMLSASSVGQVCACTLEPAKAVMPVHCVLLPVNDVKKPQIQAALECVV
jgi:hypothetical protein